MSSFKVIQEKLEQFIRKYYTNELIKGAILFFSMGLLYFLFTLFVEYVLWLAPLGRTVLFWVFVVVELILFAKYILMPLARLLKLQKGLDYENASVMIGTHFPEVNDKLLNVIQLQNEHENSELVLASIEQKSKALTPVPFKLAVNFKDNVKYLKYAVVPVLIIVISYISGKMEWFSDSYTRVVNYQTAYEPPAPFQFFVVNDSLQAIENQSYQLMVITEGELAPEDVSIRYNEGSYFLNKLPSGEFTYTFKQPQNSLEFQLTANEVSSKWYTLDVVSTPTLQTFDMVLDYPAHTYKKDEVLKNTGSATIPQGTKVSWRLKTRATEAVTLKDADSTYTFVGDENSFNLERRLMRTTSYTINTSNQKLRDYESLGFTLEVIKDAHPELAVQVKQDSTDIETLYFYGQASDDYGLRKLELVYYPDGNESLNERIAIPISEGNYSEFINIFPDNLNLKEGTAYELYFEASDNDAIQGYKTVKSQTFTYNKLTKDEISEEQLNEQNETIEELNESLDKLESREQELQELSKTQKEKSELNFNDKKKLEEFLKRQRQQDEMMQKFNEKLQDNLEKFNPNEDKEDPFKEALEQRLDEQKEQLKKDEELLKELEKLADKIQKEELSQKLEEMAKQNKSKKRSLEQVLELTKRYYVGQKMEQLRNKLNDLSEEQERLSEQSEEENTKEKQDALNDKFEDIQKELDALRKENNSLRKPMDVPNNPKEEEGIKKDQEKASEHLEQKEQSGSPQDQKSQQQNAQQRQKKAAQKMKQMSEQMGQMMSGGSGMQMSEDIDMLRQILDNLLLFSFDQEDLMNKFKSIQVNHNEYAKYLRKQQSLREHFEHVDDSLFALATRQPAISERVNKEITEIFFNVDKSMAQFSENRIYQGTAAQQYTVTSANALASYLSDALDNMEMQMNPSQGQGQGDMQLPDIIMSQEELNKQMQEGMEKQKGEQEGQQQGEQKGEQEGDKNPQNGEQGKSGENGQQQQQGEGQPGQEELNGELFEIYQRQQELRQQLQDQLGKRGLNGPAKSILQKMEDVELDLINKGFTNQTLQKMMELQHQLLKLENATFQQGEDQKRKSKTNTKNFSNTNTKSLEKAKQYFNTTEILNRQALPLQPKYKSKVQSYFKTKND